MKTLLAALLCLYSLATLSAADDLRLAALQAADDARIAAVISPGHAGLDAMLSEDLRYAHSSGNVDTKASFLEALASGKLKYASYESQERNFTFPAPGIALMSGRAHVKAVTAAGELDMILSYLAVWREEGGKWHFLAWQSAKLPPVAKAP
ncbi:MAG: hypothetical protein JWO94_1578 [Verrucomicrobiaceae bacterium]|nr:hypothetical protein [Verrucomicrobiaceae bacterium]